MGECNVACDTDLERVRHSIQPLEVRRRVPGFRITRVAGRARAGTGARGGPVQRVTG
jgi:hypothetical protein